MTIPRSPRFFATSPGVSSADAVITPSCATATGDSDPAFSSPRHQLVPPLDCATTFGTSWSKRMWNCDEALAGTHQQMEPLPWIWGSLLGLCVFWGNLNWMYQFDLKHVWPIKWEHHVFWVLSANRSGKPPRSTGTTSNSFPWVKNTWKTWTSFMMGENHLSMIAFQYLVTRWYIQLLSGLDKGLEIHQERWRWQQLHHGADRPGVGFFATDAVLWLRPGATLRATRHEASSEGESCRKVFTTRQLPWKMWVHLRTDCYWCIF